MSCNWITVDESESQQNKPCIYTAGFTLCEASTDKSIQVCYPYLSKQACNLHASKQVCKLYLSKQVCNLYFW